MAWIQAVEDVVACLGSPAGVSVVSHMPALSGSRSRHVDGTTVTGAHWARGGTRNRELEGAGTGGAATVLPVRHRPRLLRPEAMPPPNLVCVATQPEADQRNADLDPGCRIYEVCDAGADATPGDAAGDPGTED